MWHVLHPLWHHLVMRVLVVEDDPELLGVLERRLRNTGFAVDVARDLPDATRQICVYDYDCLVLDRSVPSGDSIDLLRDLRTAGSTTPVLFLTARDAVSDRVAGFEAGADDYLVKPFAMEELVARVRNLCRRRPEVGPSVLTVGDLEFDTARAEVRRAGVLLPLTNKETCVLSMLVARAASIVSRTELIEHCWDEMMDPMSNTVDVHVASLRRKLGKPQLIRTVRGHGYIIEDPA